MVSFAQLRIYESVKRIPNIKCACCGEKVIDYDKMKKTWSSVEKPLSKVISTDLKGLENSSPEVYTYLKGLAEENPTKSIDKIMENTRNYAKFREAVESTIPQDLDAAQFRRESSDRTFNIYGGARSSLRSASVVTKRFAKFKKYLSGTKLDVFEQLQIYAEKYPKKSISEIINMDEVYAFHAKKDLMQRAESREILDFHFGNIEKMIKRKSPESVERFKALKDETLEMFDTVGDRKIRTQKMKDLYSAALKECGCEKLEKKVFAELDAVPKSFITKDSFLVYARNHNYSDEAIISSIFNPKVASTEHIIPRSKQGADDVANYITLCRSCNRKRDTIPYNEFLIYHPEMKRNTERQIKTVANKVANGQMTEEYKFYPMQVSLLLKDYTKGKIKPDIKGYCSKMIEKSDKKLVENANKLMEIRQQKAVATAEKAKLRAELNNVSKKLDVLDMQSGEVSQSTVFESEVKNVMKQYLDTQV